MIYCYCVKRIILKCEASDTDKLKCPHKERCDEQKKVNKK